MRVTDIFYMLPIYYMCYQSYLCVLPMYEYVLQILLMCVTNIFNIEYVLQILLNVLPIVLCMCYQLYSYMCYQYIMYVLPIVLRMCVTNRINICVTNSSVCVTNLIDMCLQLYCLCYQYY